MATHHHRFGEQADPLVKIVGIVQTFWAFAEGDLRAEAIMLLPERQ